MNGDIELAALPAGLRAFNRAEASIDSSDALTLSAAGRTDWFIDPAGGPVKHDAPALLMPTRYPWVLKSRVSVEHAATFDAGVLVVYADGHTWAKLCLERAPSGELMVVSVVTRGVSDDCNSVVVEGEVWLRIARLDRAFAFHYSLDGQRWHMVRYFGLGEAEAFEVGFLAQSPTGQGCTATFRDIDFRATLLADVRSGV
jgi:uncharacterized protein